MKLGLDEDKNFSFCALFMIEQVMYVEEIEGLSILRIYSRSKEEYFEKY